MAKRTKQGSGKPLRLAKPRKIPKAAQAKEDQLKAVTKDIVKGARHFTANPHHSRDSPARRRLERNIQRAKILLSMLEDQAPERVPTLRKYYEEAVAAVLPK